MFKPVLFFLYLGGDFQLLFCTWMKISYVGTLVPHLSRQAVWKLFEPPPHHIQMRLHHTGVWPCLSLKNSETSVQTVVACLIARLSWLHIRYQPPPPPPPSHNDGKQPYVVTVLAASAMLKHWWGCSPCKCWSHIYGRPDLSSIQLLMF